MKIRIKTHNGELPSYLTAGKVYEVHQIIRGRVVSRIINDRGHRISIHLGENGCVYLNGGSWEIINE